MEEREKETTRLFANQPKNATERNMPTRGDRRGEVSITRAPPPQLRSPMQSPPGPVKEK